LADGATAPPHTAEPDWLTERRRRGAERAAQLELPSQKSKGWEFTDLSQLDLDAYAGPNGAGTADPQAAERATELITAPEGAARVRQVDATPLDPAAGDTAGERTTEPPAEPVVLPLSAAVDRYPDLLSAHLGSIVPPDDPFVARNDAAWRGGAFVYVPRGAHLDVPVALTAIQEAAGTALHWRSLIVLDEGAEAEVWEQYLAAPGAQGGLFNGVVELVVADGANLRYVCGQGLSRDSWVFASQRAELGRDSSLEWVALGFGSAQGKVRMETKLAGRGSSAKVTGVYAGMDTQHLDYDTTQEHAEPNTTSDLAFRGVLGDRATAVWRGMIRVDPGAQQTDAFQESRNLLLSTDAHADAIPGLEIEANDVRCTHAAAVAQIDRDQLYYLRARGLRKPEATRLIIDGFLQALVERAAEGPIRQALSGALEWRLEEILGERSGEPGR
jgi:Fe-S cluster assembly protein SufD